MNYINSYFLNVLLSLGFIEVFQKLVETELIKNIFDLLVMLVMVVLSRFFASFIERKYKRFLVKLKKKNIL